MGGMRPKANQTLYIFRDEKWVSQSSHISINETLAEPEVGYYEGCDLGSARAGVLVEMRPGESQSSYIGTWFCVGLHFQI